MKHLESRFQLQVNTDTCEIRVIVRVHLNGTPSQAQKDAWEGAIESKWSNKFKLCCRDDCVQGYRIACDLQFVPTRQDADFEVTPHPAGAPVGADTSNWNEGDNNDPTHEFGHYIGNADEYFEIDGRDYRAPNQPGGSVMNNTANDPEPRHFDLVREVAQKLIGPSANCIVQKVSVPCQP